MIMKQVCKAALLATLMVLSSACGKWPLAIEQIATDTAVEIKVSREAVPAGSLIEADVKITPPEAPPSSAKVQMKGILVPQG
jgi:hypothetical protein